MQYAVKNYMIIQQHFETSVSEGEEIYNYSCLQAEPVNANHSNSLKSSNDNSNCHAQYTPKSIT